MKMIRLVVLVSVVVLVGTMAEAQCLQCFREPRTFGGTCGEGGGDYCDRDCCGAYIGAPCRVPDFLDPCDPWSRSASFVKMSAKTRQVAPAAYFTTRRPIEERQEAIHRRLQQLDPRAPKCGSI